MNHLAILATVALVLSAATAPAAAAHDGTRVGAHVEGKCTYDADGDGTVDPDERGSFHAGAGVANPIIDLPSPGGDPTDATIEVLRVEASSSSPWAAADAAGHCAEAVWSGDTPDDGSYAAVAAGHPDHGPAVSTGFGTDPTIATVP